MLQKRLFNRKKCFVFWTSAIVILIKLITSQTDRRKVSNVTYDISNSAKVHYFKSMENRRLGDVLLMGYIRGGTTFLGDVLALRKGQFYVYEPLHKIAHLGYFKPGYKCHRKINHCVSTTQDLEAVEIIKAIYRCDHLTVMKQLRKWQYLKARGDHLLYWKLTMSEFNCQYEEDGCKEKILQQCYNSTSRISKVTRLSMSLVAHLLETLPSLKIIYLIRDPRGIMNSRSSFVRYKETRLRSEARILCRKMSEDYEESLKIQSKYPGRLYTVFYEDLALSPTETVKKLYKFVGYQFNEGDYTRLKQMTATKKLRSTRRYDTARKNSAICAGAWRTNITTYVLNETNKVCSNVYRIFGYPQLVNHNDLYNGSIPLRISTKTED